MAFVVPTKRNRFEIRESRNTPEGPRSRTLASFVELDEEAIAKALARAEAPLDAEHLRKAALRAGAPVAPSAVDRAARDLLTQLAKGQRPSPMLRRLLLDALADPAPGPHPDRGGNGVSSAARAAAEWVAAKPAERAQALEDLLRLSDAVPLRRRPATIGFPRLSSRAS
ncbi:MAG TPA: hypothetical protein VHA54_08985 [Solirubrobacterales bacterium]|nr:hypothetical protein [Solirubrobacterales bacterium]